MLFHGVVSPKTQSIVEFFLEREQAEAFLAGVEQDEPDTAALSSVVALEFEQASNEPAGGTWARPVG
jgi:hypothetical protein